MLQKCGKSACTVVTFFRDSGKVRVAELVVRGTGVSRSAFPRLPFVTDARRIRAAEELEETQLRPIARMRCYPNLRDSAACCFAFHKLTV